jgi:hypothetical protein
METTYVEKLAALQDEMGYYVGGVTLGSNPGSVEDVAKLLYENMLAIKQALETGDWESNGFETVDIDD